MKKIFLFAFLILGLQVNTSYADVVCEKTEPKIEEALTFAEGMGEILSLEYNREEELNYSPQN